MKMRVENGEVVGFLPAIPGYQYRVPLREVIEDAGFEPEDEDLVDAIDADDVEDAIAEVGVVETGRSRRRRRARRRRLFARAKKLARRGGRAWLRFHGVPTRRLKVSGDDPDLDLLEDEDDDEVAGEDDLELEVGADGTVVGRSRRSRRRARRRARRKRIFKTVKRVTKKASRVVKKVAKNKVVRGLVKVVAKAVPSPFNYAITAAQGAAKLVKAVQKGSSRAKKVLSAVKHAARGKITPKALVSVAKKVGVSAKIATDAAAVQRLAMDAVRNPKAAAAFRLAQDLVSDKPAEQSRAAAAAAQAELGDRGRAFVVQSPTGKVYQTVVARPGVLPGNPITVQPMGGRAYQAVVTQRR